MPTPTHSLQALLSPFSFFLLTLFVLISPPPLLASARGARVLLDGADLYRCARAGTTGSAHCYMRAGGLPPGPHAIEGPVHRVVQVVLALDLAGGANDRCDKASPRTGCDKC